MSHIPAELREQLTAPPTANPCPPWCELTKGHGYDSTTLDRKRRIRYHTGHGMRRSLAAGGSANVDITNEESADREDGDVRLSAPAVQL